MPSDEPAPGSGGGHSSWGLDLTDLCVVCDSLRDAGLIALADACDELFDCPTEEEEEEEPSGDHVEVDLPDCPEEAVSVYPSAIERGWATLSQRQRDYEILVPPGGGVSVAYSPSAFSGALAGTGFEVEAGLEQSLLDGTLDPISVVGLGDPVNAAIPDACLGLSAGLTTAFPFTRTYQTPGFPHSRVALNWLTLRVNQVRRVGGCVNPIMVKNPDESLDVYVLSGILPYALYSHDVDQTTGLVKMRIWVGMVHFPSFYVTPSSSARPAAMADLPAGLLDGGTVDVNTRGEFVADWMSLLGDVHARIAIRDTATRRPDRYIESDALCPCDADYASWWGGITLAGYAPSDATNSTDLGVFLSNMTWGEVCLVDPDVLTLSRSPPPLTPFAVSPYTARIRELASVAFDMLFGARVVLSHTVTFRTPDSQQFPVGEDMAVLRRWTLSAADLGWAENFWDDIQATPRYGDAAIWMFNDLDSVQFMGRGAYQNHAEIEAAVRKFSNKVPCDCA